MKSGTNVQNITAAAQTSGSLTLACDWKNIDVPDNPKALVSMSLTDANNDTYVWVGNPADHATDPGHRVGPVTASAAKNQKVRLTLTIDGELDTSINGEYEVTITAAGTALIGDSLDAKSQVSNSTITFTVVILSGVITSGNTHDFFVVLRGTDDLQSSLTPTLTASVVAK